MFGDLVDTFVKALTRDNGFLSYAGKALVIFALVSPLAYCESQRAALRHQEKIANVNAEITLQKACIEGRGEWSNITGKCKFHD